MRGERSTSLGYPFPSNLYAYRVAAEVGDAAEKKMMTVMSHEVLLLVDRYLVCLMLHHLLHGNLIISTVLVHRITSCWI